MTEVLLDGWLPVGLCSDKGLFPLDVVCVSVCRGVSRAAFLEWAPVVLGLGLGVRVVSMWPGAT